MLSWIIGADHDRSHQGGVDVSGATERFFRALVTWNDRSQQRRDLRDLDDRLLRDIGVTRAEAEEEARKPVWRR